MERQAPPAWLSPARLMTPRPVHPAGSDESRSGDSEGAAAGERAAQKPRSSSGLKEIATVVAIALVLSFLLKTFLFRAFYIPSESMVNTLDVNDRIFVNLLVPEPFALERGDVVVFRDTKGWLPPVAEKAGWTHGLGGDG
jgi:signal peptidase I